MSKRTVITAAVMMGLGWVGRARGAESETPPPPREQEFERLDQNHDGVIQREEFEQARGRSDGQRRFERGVRGKRGGDQPRGIFRDGGSPVRRIDDAIDRALERGQGDSERLRRALHEELSQIMRKGRGRLGPPDAPLAAPDAERLGRRHGTPRDELPGSRGRRFDERGGSPGPADGEGFSRGRHRRGAGDREGAGPQRRNPDERAERIMDRFDGNDDGVLIVDELDAERAKRLMRADANGDGRVDRDELLTMLRKIGDEGGRVGRRGPDKPDAPLLPPSD